MKEKFLSGAPPCSRTIHPFRECKGCMKYCVSFEYFVAVFFESLMPSLLAQRRLPWEVEERWKNFLKVLKVDHGRS